jgi:formylglycine-generating enzyme required for sulfatase activity
MIFSLLFESFTLFSLPVSRGARAWIYEFRRGWSSTGSGAGGGCARVLRGGSWNNDDPRNLSPSNRNNNHPDNRDNNVGFRVVWLGVSAERKV